LPDSLAEVRMGSGFAITSIPTGTKTIQKMQIRIIPFIFVLFVVAFLDRINIGFAALTMNKELGITSQEFGLVAGIFFSVIAFLKSPAICCCTRSERVFGLPGL
jgi:sugar phosphate permease